MSVDRFLNIMRQQASLVNNSIASTAIGTIVAYDQSQHYASVQLYPADPDDASSSPMITGMLPIFSPWVGANWGMFSPPAIGDIVEVHFQEGSLQNGYIGMRTWNLGHPPLSVPSGEFWLVHQTGSYIKMKNNGEIDISTPVKINVSCATAEITATTSAKVTSPNIQLSGSVQLGNLSQSLTGLMNDVAIGVYNSHTHSDPQGGTTGVPNQLISPSTALTTNVTAN